MVEDSLENELFSITEKQLVRKYFYSYDRFFLQVLERLKKFYDEAKLKRVGK